MRSTLLVLLCLITVVPILTVRDLDVQAEVALQVEKAALSEKVSLAGWDGTKIASRLVGSKLPEQNLLKVRGILGKDPQLKVSAEQGTADDVKIHITVMNARVSTLPAPTVAGGSARSTYTVKKADLIDGGWTAGELSPDIESGSLGPITIKFMMNTIGDNYIWVKFTERAAPKLAGATFHGKF
eukprot:gnl/TRDRNA2_/TRDRNA2_191756_c0_seq1.p1 gnl/TRDRNA2_/TRDRNA2_191756_c0~~gnl/TRDRNA2_/TRDRNA2_191756_c0_seq1.p1  ORF type:complete len:184 (-),score=30.46 gnl/TRDRNA2_/TRDRNA2_191756_c0_seq1:53-604(-)